MDVFISNLLRDRGDCEPTLVFDNARITSPRSPFYHNGSWVCRGRKGDHEYHTMVQHHASRRWNDKSPVGVDFGLTLPVRRLDLQPARDRWGSISPCKDCEDASAVSPTMVQRIRTESWEEFGGIKMQMTPYPGLVIKSMDAAGRLPPGLSALEIPQL